MPIKIPDALPARAILEQEKIFVMPYEHALHQDIRPLRVLILNLMPTKIVTETQLLRCLSNTPLQIEITLMKTSSYKSKNTSEEHLLSFYTTFDKIEKERFDGFIITGAPVETLPFEQVQYWDELRAIMDWSLQNVTSTFHICWGAQAGLYHHYGVQKHPLPDKLFGVFEHDTLLQCPLTRGFDDRFWAPHSRHTEVRAVDIENSSALELLAASPEAGFYLAQSRDGKHIFVTGHGEYDAETLSLEYFRDLQRGEPIALPRNYFPGDDPSQTPRKTWRSHTYLLYANWINYYVYQITPFDLTT